MDAVLKRCSEISFRVVFTMHVWESEPDRGIWRMKMRFFQTDSTMNSLHRKSTTPVTSSSKSSTCTPLLTDEELDALIEAFNRDEYAPARPNPVLIGLSLLAVSVAGLGAWWWS